VTPEQRHNGEAEGILAQRQQVIEAARNKHPERWKNGIRTLALSDEVHLNRERKVTEHC